MTRGAELRPSEAGSILGCWFPEATFASVSVASGRFQSNSNPTDARSGRYRRARGGRTRTRWATLIRFTRHRGVALSFVLLWLGALAVALQPEASAWKFPALLIVITPVVLPAALVLTQGTSAFARRFARRVAIRRARGVFRTTLQTARLRHPELCDLDRLREAADCLARVSWADGFVEVREASEHPYRPIQRIAEHVLRGARRDNRSRSDAENAPTS